MQLSIKKFQEYCNYLKNIRVILIVENNSNDYYYFKKTSNEIAIISKNSILLQYSENIARILQLN